MPCASTRVTTDNWRAVGITGPPAARPTLRVKAPRDFGNGNAVRGIWRKLAPSYDQDIAFFEEILFAGGAAMGLRPSSRKRLRDRRWNGTCAFRRNGPLVLRVMAHPRSEAA